MSRRLHRKAAFGVVGILGIVSLLLPWNSAMASGAAGSPVVTVTAPYLGHHFVNSSIATRGCGAGGASFERFQASTGNFLLHANVSAKSCGQGKSDNVTLIASVEYISPVLNTSHGIQTVTVQLNASWYSKLRANDRYSSVSLRFKVIAWLENSANQSYPTGRTAYDNGSLHNPYLGSYTWSSFLAHTPLRFSGLLPWPRDYRVHIEFTVTLSAAAYTPVSTPPWPLGHSSGVLSMAGKGGFGQLYNYTSN